MKIVIPGGTGNVGGLLRRALSAAGHEVVVLGRHSKVLELGIGFVQWDAKTLGPWTSEVDGADAVINLAGRSVSCRYTDANLRQMMNSRVDSTLIVGEAIAAAKRPPAVWLQASTATIYADRRDGFNDEATGIIGGNEANVPLYWEYSVRIAKNWEAAQMKIDTPTTRRVALRSAMVMSPGQGSIFDALLMLARLGVGGSVAGGSQKISWIHGADFVRSILFILNNNDISGPINLAAPNPLPQSEFMKLLRRAWGQRVGLPATKQMISVGAYLLRSDPELILKSRSVIPGRLIDAGFVFDFPEWQTAVKDLVEQVRVRPEGTRLDRTARQLVAYS